MKLRARNNLVLLALFLIILMISPPFQKGIRDVAQELIGKRANSLGPLAGEAAPEGTEFYIEQNHPGASDSNPGTQDSPWFTIQHAANVLQPGDTVFVTAGTYEEQVQMNVSGELGYPITFKAEEGVIVRGFRIHDQSYIRIIGFEITHQGSDVQHECIHMIRAHGVEILDNYIHHVYTLGIWMHTSGGSTKCGDPRQSHAIYWLGRRA